MNKRILYLCLQATREGQASFSHVNEIIAGLRELGWKVALCEPAYAASRGKVGAWRRAAGMVSAQLAANRKLGAVDVVYIRSHFAALLTAAWASYRGVCVVHENNGPYEDAFVAWPWLRLFAPWVKLTLRWQWKQATGIITNTPQLADWMRGEGVRCPARAIPNGTNTEIFRPLEVSAAARRRPFVVFFGALARWQGIPTLLDAMRLPSWPAGVRLVVAGDGPDRHLVAKAEASHGDVDYAGVVPQKDLPKLLAGAIATLSPKSRVGDRPETGWSPLKLYESLSCGVPVIVTDLPGQVEVVREHDCGLVIPPDDPAALAAAVAELHQAQDRAAEMGERGRSAVVARHSWRHRAADTSQFLLAVCEAEAEREGCGVPPEES